MDDNDEELRRHDLVHENIEAWDAVFGTPAGELFELDLPVEIAGCQLVEGPGPAGGKRTFDIQSRGPLGGRHGTLFKAYSDIAFIAGIGKIGWFGYRLINVPIERHVQVLRELGFKEMVFPNGKRYEIRTWPGVRRIRG